jgi:4,5-DOPA dioxygenase extradiol
MPVLFIGHGSPENAVENNEFTKEWESISKKISHPKAILVISAHWLTEGSAVLSVEKPRTIHDFYGFPDELYVVEYKANGAVDLAKRIQKLVKSVKVNLDTEWGLDHGAWSILMHMYPKADVPVLQLSLDYTLSLEKQYEIGKELSVLRSEGVLIIGSGNIVHNLRLLDFEGNTFEWAIGFDKYVKNALEKRDDEAIIHYDKSEYAKLAHPTDDHFLPLLYILGAADKNEKPKFYCEGIVYGSISMRCVVFDEQ